MATQVIGEADQPGDVSGSLSYELEPERLQRALGPSFVLGQLIGRGGYAEVFSARDLRLKRDVAIKVIRPDLIMTHSLLGRFRREAEAVAALHHPQIVPVFDVGEADGICYIVMPLVKGISLKAVLHKEGILPLPEVRRILTEAADALNAAHLAGVIHRDIKPENIMLEGPERRVLLMDFGIAKAVDANDREATATGVIVGTPQFMSPEQASGDPNIDHRTDQYSLAVVGYQMVSGRVPFEGETARAIMTKQLLDPPAPLTTVVPGLPVPLARALHRALQKDRTRRFDDIKSFAEAVNAATTTLGPEWERELGHPVADSRRRYLPWLIAAAVVAIAAVAMAEWPRAAKPEAAALEPLSPAAPVAQPTSPTAPPPAPPTKFDPPLAKVTTPAPDSPPATAPQPVPTTAVKVDSPKVEPAPPPPTCGALFDQKDWPRASVKCLQELGGGDPKVQAMIGVMLAERLASITVGPKDSTDLILLAAKNGNAAAQYMVAGRYEFGHGTGIDPTEATNWYMIAAKNGYRDAYFYIANRLEIGLGRPRNLSEAARWYELAANGGDQKSQFKLGVIFANGLGRPKDEAAAKKYFEAAASSGNHDAEYELGMLYLKGRGTLRSEEAGLDWIRKSAAGGNLKAKKELAERTR